MVLYYIVEMRENNLPTNLNKVFAKFSFKRRLIDDVVDRLTTSSKMISSKVVIMIRWYLTLLPSFRQKKKLRRRLEILHMTQGLLITNFQGGVPLTLVIALYSTKKIILHIKPQGSQFIKRQATKIRDSLFSSQRNTFQCCSSSFAGSNLLK